MCIVDPGKLWRTYRAWVCVEWTLVSYGGPTEHGCVYSGPWLAMEDLQSMGVYSGSW